MWLQSYQKSMIVSQYSSCAFSSFAKLFTSIWWWLALLPGFAMKFTIYQLGDASLTAVVRLFVIFMPPTCCCQDMILAGVAVRCCVCLPQCVANSHFNNIPTCFKMSMQSSTNIFSRKNLMLMEFVMTCMKKKKTKTGEIQYTIITITAKLKWKFAIICVIFSYLNKWK